MEPLNFSGLLNTLEELSSSKEQNTILKSTATNNDFTGDQVMQVLEKMAFSKEQLQALEILRPQLSQLGNLFGNMDVFDFGKAGTLSGQPTDVKADPQAKTTKSSQPANLPAAMEPSAFANLLATISEHKFPKEQLYLIELAAFRNTFTAAQVVQILEKIKFPRYKLKTLEILRYRIVDPENHFLLLKTFTRSSEKKKVSELLKLNSAKQKSQKRVQLSNQTD
jgi:hypothetical protein